MSIYFSNVQYIDSMLYKKTMGSHCLSYLKYEAEKFCAFYLCFYGKCLKMFMHNALNRSSETQIKTKIELFCSL